MDVNLKLKEFNISVPWGHIAVKSWGNESHFPILAIHGIQDNAGSFDQLVSLLPQTYNYVCIDLPSHGRSSRFTEHIPIHLWNFVLALKFVTDHFNWDKFILMGHSLGAHIALQFAIVFPEKVEKLILLDIISLLAVEPDKFVSHLCDRYEKILEENRQISNKPVDTLDDALHELNKQRVLFPLKKKAAEMILPRSVVECPILILLSTENGWNWPKDILQAFQKQRNIKIQWLSGDHYFHIVGAKSIALVIGNYLGLSKSKI
ncbi:serine hydrolase-like protein [Cylas formicarius]|uniref:serine hydrolase-like protein n=1 Tax=Cylas formicarius TaxID=197179 RepID=UPI002958D7F9|nr:serine hydrolase-like protein [Cylas formicarius]